MTDPLAYTPADLGFSGDAASGWTKHCRGVTVRFTVLRTLADLLPTERLQLAVFGVTERDLVPANELVVVEETGGEVYGAYIQSENGAELCVGTLIGWGGYYAGRPRIVSDFLAIDLPYRNLGLGGDLKRLQAARSLERGFEEIVWTVDPLRAANARLNFEKLGATSDHYERNRYGEEFGAGLYGGMPTDRLHVSWEIGSERVRQRLVDSTGATEASLAGSLPVWTPDLDLVQAPGGAHRALLALPADIDTLLAHDPAAALAWRMSLRSSLEAAFASGWRVTGFLPGTDPVQHTGFYLMEQTATTTTTSPKERE